MPRLSICLWLLFIAFTGFSSDTPDPSIAPQGRDLPTKERSWTLASGNSVFGKIMAVDPKTEIVEFSEMTPSGKVQKREIPLLEFSDKNQEFLERWQTGIARGSVIGITDGDTFNLLTPAREQLKIRLHGVDAPELQQPYNKKAKRKLSDLIFQKEVIVHLRKQKSFERFVGTVYIEPTGANACLEMVKAGFSWHAVKFLKDNETYKAAEKQARDKKLGLWLEKDTKAPWEFRHRGKKPRTAEELIEKGAKIRVMEPRFISLRKPVKTNSAAKFVADGRTAILTNLTSAIWSPPPRIQRYWISKSSQVRHNEYCRFFKESGNGQLIKHIDGKPCKFCGG